MSYTEALRSQLRPCCGPGHLSGTSTIQNPTGVEGSESLASGLASRAHRSVIAVGRSRGPDDVASRAGYRLKDDTNLWTYGPDGSRGADPGAPAFRLVSTTSTTKGCRTVRSRPMDHTGRINTDIVNDQVRHWQRAWNSVLRAGSISEWEPNWRSRRARRWRSSRARLRHPRHHSWQDIPSGIYLPDVLEASRSQVATQWSA